MSVGLGIVSDAENASALLFAGVNVLVLAMLVSRASSDFVHKLDNQVPETKREHAGLSDVHLRLQSFWLVTMVVLTATVLKFVLSAQLADQIIAAWFVGQGFALQPYVQSYLSGIVLRSNPYVYNKLNNANTIITYSATTYRCVRQHILSITLVSRSNESTIVTVPWTEVRLMKLT